MNSLLKDSKIIEEVLGGNFEQYSQLVLKYNHEVLKVVSAMLFNHQEMEDLVQKVFIDAYDKLHTFDTDRDFSKWIKGIARNAVRMYLRTKKNVDKKTKIYQEWALMQFEGDEDFEILDSKSKALAQCFQQVSEGNQKILNLKYRKLLPIQQIAERLGRSLDGITKALSRTRAELKNCIRRKMLENE